MRIGIMGLGRIGAFHAETLSGLDAVDDLVVTDPVAAAAAPCTVADAIEASWIAEACTLSLREHRPVRLEEVRTA